MAAVRDQRRNDIPKKVDEIQSETGEGPWIDAIKEHEVFQTGDLRNEKRWPHFSTRAQDVTGICSILSIRLFVEEETMGSQNLTTFKGNRMGGESIYFDLATLCEQAGLPLEEVRAAARARAGPPRT